MNGLVGYTGFVGSNLKDQHTFNSFYNSKNVHEIHQQHFDLLVYAGTRAEKWYANAHPLEDEAHINSIINNLLQVSAKKIILISTVDVYSNPFDVTEENSPNIDVNQPYGKNRARLEEFIRNHFEDHLIVRLPALFGKGLKKNMIFDFLNNNTDKVDSRNSYQFYNLNHIWKDIQRAENYGIKILNITSEPVTAKEIASTCFNFSFTNEILPHPVKYNFKSAYADIWGGRDGYFYSKSQTLSDLKEFITSHKRPI